MEVSRILMEEIFYNLIRIDTYNHNCVHDDDCILPVEINTLVNKLRPLLKVKEGIVSSDRIC